MIRSLLIAALAATVAGLPSPSPGAGPPKGPELTGPGAVRHFHEIDTGAAPYAVTATEYPGLGTPGVHPFLVAESEVRATVDAVRAAHQISGGLSKKWFAVGHSQGGQAALASAELADDYDGRLEFQGAVAFAPAANMSGWASDIASANPVEQEFYAMMLVGQRTQHPGLRWGDYLGRNARALLPAVRTVCFDDLTSVFVSAQLPVSEYEPRDAAATDRLFHWFLANEVGHQRADGPLLVIQGSADVIVPEPATREMVSLARSNGSDVEYRVYEGADHAVYTDGESALFAWLAGSLATRNSGGGS